MISNDLSGNRETKTVAKQRTGRTDCEQSQFCVRMTSGVQWDSLRVGYLWKVVQDIIENQI